MGINVDRVVGLLKDLEGFREYVYDDKSAWPRSEVQRADCRFVAGQYKVIATGGTATVGFGETSADFIDRYWGRQITQAEALAKMAQRVKGFYDGVRSCITATLTEHQWEAVTCRAYQTGAGGFCRSETAKLINAGRMAEAVKMWRSEFAHPARSDVEIAHFMTPDKGAKPVDGWMPDVIHTPPNSRAGLNWVEGTAWKQVWHTTESNYRRSQGGRVNYHGHQSYPHFEVSEDAIEQYLPITVGAYALAASSEWGIGNGAHAVQLELVWAADNARNISEKLMWNVARVLTWQRSVTGMAPNLPPQGLPERVSQSNWFSKQGWYDFEGICGHGNVPGNFDRWDPGPLPADRIVAMSNEQMGTTPQPEGDLAMLTFRYIHGGQDWVFDGPSKLFFQLNDERQITEVLDPLGIKALGKVSDVTHDRYREIASAAGFSG